VTGTGVVTTPVFLVYGLAVPTSESTKHSLLSCFSPIGCSYYFCFSRPFRRNYSGPVRTCSFPSIPYAYFALLLLSAEQSGTCKAIQFAHWLFFKLHLTHSSPMLKLIILATYDPTQILLQHITAFGHLYSASHLFRWSLVLYVVIALSGCLPLLFISHFGLVVYCKTIIERLTFSFCYAVFLSATVHPIF